MATTATAALTPTPEHRRIAAQQHEHARQAIEHNSIDYGIALLLSCCKLDPGNLIYRQALRMAQRRKYGNNGRGSALAFLTTLFAKIRLRWAKQSGNDLGVLEHGERILSRSPWNAGVMVDMALSAGRLGLIETAIWLLEIARQGRTNELRINRPLAQFYEQHGDFERAIFLWELVGKADPGNEDVARKGKDLAASQTIAKGQYEDAIGSAGGDKRNFLEPVDAPQSPGTQSENRTTRQVEPIRAKLNADPSNVNHYLQLAEVYRKVEQWDKVREILTEGLGPTGQNFELQIQLAELDIDPFRVNLQHTEEKLRANPNDEETRRVRMRLLKEINTREMDVYRKRADRFPTEMSWRLELGIRLLRAGQADEAIQELQQVRKDPRHKGRALLYLGHCFKTKNNWPLAKRNFQEALQELPPSEDASRKELMFQLAKGAADEQDWATAIAMGNDLANLDYAYRDIGRLLDEWQRKGR